MDGVSTSGTSNKTDANDMKAILEGFHDASTKEVVNESASMNISMTADDAGQVGQLMAMMRNAGMNPQEVSAPTGNMRSDMEKFRSALDDNPDIPGRDDVPGDQDLTAGAIGSGIGAGAGSALAGGALGGPLGALAGGGGLGGAAGAALGGMVGGPLGAAAGGAIGGALNSDDEDDPNIPGRDDVEGDQDLQAGMLGSLAGGVLGGAAGSTLGAGAADALGAAGGALGGAIAGPTGAAIGQAAGKALPALAGSVAGSSIGDKLTGEDYENEPNEHYSSYSDMSRSGNDLNKSKKSYPKVAGGDNPMALKDKIKEELETFYQNYKK